VKKNQNNYLKKGKQVILYTGRDKE
jgi:hypothetical protein